MASVVGVGSRYPYRTPSLIVLYEKETNDLSIYVSNAGYSGCDNKKIKVTFKGADTILNFWGNSSMNDDAWFITDRWVHQQEARDHLLQELMKWNTAIFRLESDCGQIDCTFSLRGSSKAIKAVVPSYHLLPLPEQQKVKRRIRTEKDSLKRVNSDRKEAYTKCIRYGNIYLDRGQYDSAIFYYQKAGGIMPTDSFYLKKLKSTQRLLGMINQLNDGSYLKVHSDYTPVLKSQYAPLDTLQFLNSGIIIKNFYRVESDSSFIRIKHGTVEGYIRSTDVRMY